MRCFLGLAWVGMIALPAIAQPVVDGTRVGDSYGPARAVQIVETGFGNNLSEWNAAYGLIDNGALHLLFTGNLEGNFNKLEVFLDTHAGGSNVLDSVGNDGAGAMNGLPLDAAFAPEYHFIFRRGFAGTDIFDVDLATLNSGALGPGSVIISGANAGDPGKDIFGGSQTGAASGIGGTSLAVAYDDSNVAGIDECNTPDMSGCQAADQTAALAVDTGLELSIDLADIGNPNSNIKVMLLQNNQGHDFLSNQTLGALPAGTDNLGGPAGLDFNNFAGDQFFVIPEPATVAILLLGAMGALAYRLRQIWG